MRSATHDIVVYPGDILFVRSKGIFGRLIAWFTTKKGERTTWATHVGVFVTEGMLLGNGNSAAQLIEALKRVEMHTFLPYRSREDSFMVARPKMLTTSQQVCIVDYAHSYLGAIYGYGKVLLHALDSVIGDRYFFRRLGKLDRFPICSYLVAKCYSCAGLNFGVPPGQASPDDIWDYCLQHPEKYKFVYYSCILP